MSDKLPDDVEETLRVHVECDKPECASCSAIRLSIAQAIRDSEERMRERAAKVCDDLSPFEATDGGPHYTALDCAEAIRSLPLENA